MASTILNKVRTSSGLIQVSWKWFCCIFSKHKLPPGNFANLYTREIKDQRYLLKKFEHHGPILRTRMGEYLTICIFGLKRCRKFLVEHDENLIPVSFEIKPAIPKGFMREMVGDDHKKYRAILMKGTHAGGMETYRESYRTIISETLKEYHSHQSPKQSPQTFIDALDTIGQSILLHMFFGAEFGTDFDLQLKSIYKKMWDERWHFYMEKSQLEALEELKVLLLKTLKDENHPSRLTIKDNILGRIHDAGSLDETILVNLIYMVETGRFAVYSLMRWSTKYAVENKTIYDRIASDPHVFSNENDCIAQAFVQESLRLNQIERLQRCVVKSFVFEGFLVPKGSIARLSIWEAHKSEDVFPDPFSFNPQRFIDRKFSMDEYAPFGLGSHRCPHGAASIQICRLYLHYLSTKYNLEGIGNGPPSRGIAHYEPAKEFTVLLHPK